MLPAKLFLFLLVVVPFLACKKEKHAWVNWTRMESGTSLDLKSICRLNASDTFFVCGGKREEQGIILRSSNKGKSWQTIFEKQGISFNKIHFKNSLLGFALGDFLDIYKTIDGGITWKQTAFADTVSFNYKVVLRDIEILSNSSILVSGGDDFGNGIILKSEDEGEKWTAVITEDHELRSLKFTDNQHGFASGYGVLLSSNDGGKQWESTSLSDDFFTGLKFIDTTTGFICGYNGNLYKSSDGGQSWNKTLKGNSLFSTSRNHFNCLDFADAQNGIAAGENGFVLLTQDGGSNWKICSCPDKNGIQEIKLAGVSSGWAVGDAGSIYSFEIK